MRTRKFRDDQPRVAAAQCPTCKTLIISASRHDYHSCPCGEIAIDGGRDYYRGAFKNVMPKTCPIHLVGKLTYKEIQDESYKDNDQRVFTTLHPRIPINRSRFIYTLDKKARLRRYRMTRHDKNRLSAE